MSIDLCSMPDLTFSLVSGRRALAEAIVRRLQTSRGSLFYAEDYGIDVRDMILSRLDEQALFNWKAAIERECLADDRVTEATCHLTFSTTSGQLLVSIQVGSEEDGLIDISGLLTTAGSLDWFF